MRFSRSVKCTSALALFFGLQGSAGATSMVRLSTDQMTDASDLIVRGEVVEVWTEVDARGAVWTRAQVLVDEVLKGDPATEAVVVDQMGGTWGGVTTVVHGAARFDVGEEAVLFLDQLGSGRVVPVGMLQGKFTVRLDPATREELAQRVVMPPSASYDHRFLPLPSAADRLTVDTLETQVRDRLALGWDGQPIPGADTAELRRINRLQPGVK